MVMTLIRWTLVTGGTAAYLGLAILGWGGWTAFFAHPARVALALVLAVLAGVALCADGNLSPGLREDRGNRWVIGALTLLGLLAAYLPAYTDRKELWTIDGETMRWLGVVIDGEIRRDFLRGHGQLLCPVVGADRPPHRSNTLRHVT